jgi:hypothetical protein
MVTNRGRSRFIVSAEVRRERQLKALEIAAGSWKDRDHPELAGGAGRWVSRMRRESDGRLHRRRRRGG